MHINFGSIIPINGVYVINKNDLGQYKSYLKYPPISIFQTLSRRINSQKEGYFDKLSGIDTDLSKNPFCASIYNGVGKRFILTGKAAKKYRDDSIKYYRNETSYQEYDKANQDNFLKEAYLYDKLGKKVYLDLFVTQNKNNKYELQGIDMVDIYGKKACTSFAEKDGQLLLPL